MTGQSVNPDVEAAVAAIDFHQWNPTTRLCACGEFFEADSRTIPARKSHVARAALTAGLRSMLEPDVPSRGKTQ